MHLINGAANRFMPINSINNILYNVRFVEWVVFVLVKINIYIYIKDEYLEISRNLQVIHYHLFTSIRYA